MHRCLALLVVVLATVPWAATRAQQASFDCLQASLPIENLICSDPQLLAMDGDLGDAFAAVRRRLPASGRDAALAEQRAWLAERLTRCGVPAKGEEVAPELRWKAAPCLDAMYRARLTALGASPPPAVVMPAAANERGFLHPACLWSAVEQDMEQQAAATDGPGPGRIPLGACLRGSRHIPIEETGIGLSSPGASDGTSTSIAYRSIGTLADGREAIVVWYNTGGSGLFSEIFVLRRTPSADGRDIELSADLVGGGGDRCNGGIAAATLSGPQTLEVDYQVTPLDLLSEADETLADENMDTLALCAVCCTGTVRRSLDLASKQETTVSATVDLLLSREAEGGGSGSAQACFDSVIAKAAGSLPHTFPAAELKTLAKTFARTCRPAPGARGK